jgi:hypothetical protein
MGLDHETHTAQSSHGSLTAYDMRTSRYVKRAES